MKEILKLFSVVTLVLFKKGIESLFLITLSIKVCRTVPRVHQALQSSCASLLTVHSTIIIYEYNIII